MHSGKLIRYHGKKRLRAYFKASPLGLEDTYGLESHALAGTHSFERLEWVSWGSAEVSSCSLSVFQAQSQHVAYSGIRAC